MDRDCQRESAVAPSVEYTADKQSGVFRPEMLEPMGLPKGVRVLGWGMSLERPTMIKYKIQDIRTLVGHKTDLLNVKSAAAVRLDKGDE